MDYRNYKCNKAEKKAEKAKKEVADLRRIMFAKKKNQ